MLGVQTDMLRLDQQFMRDTHTTVVVCNLSAVDATNTLRPFQQNFFTNQNQLNGKTITGITAYGNVTGDLSQIGWATPNAFTNFDLFVLTLVDFDGQILLNQFPVDVLSDPNTGAVTYAFTKRFLLYNINWSASYVMATSPFTVDSPGNGNSIIFFVQYENSKWQLR